MSLREIRIQCRECKQNVAVLLNWADYLAWKDKSLTIKEAMPYLTQLEREFLAGGVCGECVARREQGETA